MALNSNSRVPFTESLIEAGGKLTTAWESFFRWVYDNLAPLGSEKYFSLKDNTANQVTDDLQFDFLKVNFVLIDYIVQRVSLGPGATELIEGGTLRLVYRPRTQAWNITKINNGPDNAGVTFTVSAGGLVRVSTSDVTGLFTAGSISKMTYRARTLSAKFNSPTGGFL